MPRLEDSPFFFAGVACGDDFGGLLRSRCALVEPLSASLTPLLLPGAAVAVTLVAAANFVLVERPAIRLGALLARRGGSRAPLRSKTPY